MNEWETCISEWADRCNERDKEIASLKTRLAACEADMVKAEARVQALEQEQVRLKDLLRELADLQNGPPLEKYASSWQACMDQVYRALEGG